MYTQSQLCFCEDIYRYSFECNFSCGKYGAYFHALSVHRSYDPSNDQKTTDSNGNGLLCSVKVGSDLHSFLLTCCHIFLKEEEERTEMMVEDFTAAMLRCKEAKYEFSGRDSMKAKEVLEDCENPVIYFHQVSGWRVQLY